MKPIKSSKRPEPLHKKPMTPKVPAAMRDLDSVREAVLGIRKLRKQIAAHNQGKPKLTNAKIKSWITEGQR